MENRKIKEFIRERADPEIVTKLVEAERSGDIKTFNRLKTELMRRYMEYDKVY